MGLLWPYLSKLGLGRLPGDIVIERETVTLYMLASRDLRFSNRGRLHWQHNSSGWKISP
jgi:hypothetical protein